MSGRILCLLVTPDFKPGDPEPSGYLDWHAWAEVQRKAGIRQTWCVGCSRWQFPQVTCCPGQDRLTPRQYRAEFRRAAELAERMKRAHERRRRGRT